MAHPSIPNQIPDDPIAVTERLIKQMNCPNPSCAATIDITNVNVGTKIQCKDCNNVTWLPSYKKERWWQKPAVAIGGLLLSFLIGVAASVTANWIGVPISDTNNQQSLQSKVVQK